MGFREAAVSRDKHGLKGSFKVINRGGFLL